MRLGGTKATAIHQYRGLGNQLYDLAGSRPSLDLRFADSKSLVDATTGQNLVTFTRASSGTYVDSQGVIRNATTNLLLQSEAFGTSPWSTGGSAAITANQETAPNGTLTADLLTTPSAGTNRVLQAGLATTSTTYTASAYVKAGSVNGLTLRLFFSGGTTIDTYADFIFASGIFTAVNGVGTFTAQNVGGGWFRIACTAGSGNNTAWEMRIGGLITTGQTGTTALLWGAQLEQSSTVGEYVPTGATINSAPRFDHNPTTGESLGLLVEEQRTNLVVQSEDFGTTWATTGLLAFGSGSTLNATTAPTGVSTADLITEDTSNGNHRISTAAISWAGNTQYTFSCFVKANGRSNISLLFGTAGNWVNSSREAQFNLSTGIVTYTSGTPVTASITAFPSGWYRLTMTATTVAVPSASAVFIQMMDSTPLFSYTGNGTSGVFLFGGMLEAGAFPTSYIPTTTAAATRSADVASISGSNFSSWYRQDEGTMFADWIRSTSATGAGRVALLTDGTANNRNYDLRQDSSSSLTAIVVNNTNLEAALSLSLNTATGRNLLACAVAANNAAASTNGVAALSDNSVSIPAVNRAELGSFSGTSFINGHLRRLTYWGQRLGNEVLQRITQ